jgi:hypothetical protein
MDEMGRQPTERERLAKGQTPCTVVSKRPASFDARLVAGKRSSLAEREGQTAFLATSAPSTLEFEGFVGSRCVSPRQMALAPAQPSAQKHSWREFLLSRARLLRRGTLLLLCRFTHVSSQPGCRSLRPHRTARRSSPDPRTAAGAQPVAALAAVLPGSPCRGCLLAPYSRLEVACLNASARTKMIKTSTCKNQKLRALGREPMAHRAGESTGPPSAVVNNTQYSMDFEVARGLLRWFILLTVVLLLSSLVLWVILRPTVVLHTHQKNSRCLEEFRVFSFESIRKRRPSRLAYAGLSSTRATAP